MADTIIAKGCAMKKIARNAQKAALSKKWKKTSRTYSSASEQK
jgi:hypothetical protein